MTPPPNPGKRPNPELSDEVEAFLRSVQQKQGQRQATRAPQQRQPPRRPTGQPVTAEVVETLTPAPVPTLVSEADRLGRGAALGGDTVAQDAEGVGKQAQSLGSEIDHADERIAEQIHGKFDHQLGQLDAGHAASDDVTEATSQRDGGSMDLATDLRRMLSDPRDVCRAIVLSEILQPPVDRW